MADDPGTPVQHDNRGKWPCTRRGGKLGARIARRAAHRAGIKRQRLSNRCPTAQQKDHEQKLKSPHQEVALRVSAMLPLK